MIVYEVFEEKNHEGKYYTKWELPIGFPVPHDFVLVPPSDDFKNPKFDRVKNIWVESEDDLVKDLVGENEILNGRITLLEDAMLDLVLARGVEI